MNDSAKLTLIIIAIPMIVLGLFLSSFLIPQEKYEVRYIEGIIEDVEVRGGGTPIVWMITIHFSDGVIITLDYIDYIFVVGEKYGITYEIHPKSPYAKFKIINIEHLEVS